MHTRHNLNYNQPTMSESTQPKPLLKSRTIAVNIVIILSTFIPAVGDWVKANPDDTLIMLGAVNVILRLVTKERVVLWSKSAPLLLACLFLLPSCQHAQAEIDALATQTPLPVPGFEPLHDATGTQTLLHTPSEVEALRNLQPLPLE